MLIGIAGSIQRDRRDEFRGELAMLQDLGNEAGMDYAIGAVIGASVELATVRRKPLRLNGVSKAFGNVQAVNGVTLEIPAGKITALLGGNGAGKSTLLNLLTGVYQQDGGSIQFDGIDIDRPRARDGIACAPRTRDLRTDDRCGEHVAAPAEHGWPLRRGSFVRVSKFSEPKRPRGSSVPTSTRGHR